MNANPPTIATVDGDVLVVGSGIAGLSAALAAVPHRVTVLTKTSLGAGSSAWAQGGVAAALGRDDSPANHAADTAAVGVGINDPDAVRVLTTEGPDRVRALLALGARVDRHADGTLALGREAAHSARRIVHAADATGAELVRTLQVAVREHESITVVEHALALDLVVDRGRVTGAVARHRDGRVVLHRAGAVVLATGGSGRLYEATTNPPEATADGLALAARAGATLRDLEFVQFHPTALAAPGVDPLPLVTEALRGEGAVLVDESGRRFVFDVHPDGELAPRDVVARAIAAHRLAGHEVYLDARAALGERFAERFPTVYASCVTRGIDPVHEPIPVSPAEHYHMGGIATDLDGRSDVPGLLAAGEAACTGVHGANRLASNSLLEAMVFGARAGAAAAADAVDEDEAAVDPTAVDVVAPVAAGVDAAAGRAPATRTLAEVRRVMWRLVGLVRDGVGLAEAVGRLDSLAAQPLDDGGLDTETANLVLVARLVARAALARTESRGAHNRIDHPDTDPAWAVHLDVRLRTLADGSESIELTTSPALAMAGAR